MLPLGAIFEPSLSVGPEDDTVTCLNLVVAVSGGRGPGAGPSRIR